jgi:hypothetical protein
MDKMSEESIEKHGCRLNIRVKCRHLREIVSKDINSKKLTVAYCVCEDHAHAMCVPNYEYNPDNHD